MGTYPSALAQMQQVADTTFCPDDDRNVTNIAMLMSPSADRFNVSSVCRVLVFRVWPLRNKVRGAHNTLHYSHAALPSATQRKSYIEQKNEELMIERKQRKDGTTAARAAEQARLSNERQSRRNSQLARCCGPGLQHRTTTVPTIEKIPSRIVSLRHCAEFLSSILQ